MLKNDLIKAINEFDWYYDRSDDMRVYRKGKEAEDRLKVMVDKLNDPEVTALYKRKKKGEEESIRPSATIAVDELDSILTSYFDKEAFGYDLEPELVKQIKNNMKVYSLDHYDEDLEVYDEAASKIYPYYKIYNGPGGVYDKYLVASKDKSLLNLITSSV